MTRESSGPTRRRLLAVAAAASALGTGVGAGVSTGSYLADLERVSTEIRAGRLAVTVDCDGESCVRTDEGVAVSFDGIEPGTTGSERLRVSVEGNPARVTLATACPPTVDPLGEALLVRLSIDDGCGTGDGETRLFPADGTGWGTLDEFRTAFAGGRRLDDEDDPCLPAGEEVCLLVEYELPADATWTADLESELVFRLFAEQCRHVPEGGAGNPFEGTACPELECPDCLELGKFEVVGDRIAPGTYSFDEVYDPFAGDGHEYAMEVTTVTNKGTHDRETICAAFRLMRDGVESDAPPVCEVAVRGGPAPKSKGPAEKRYDLEPPTTRTRGELCTKRIEKPNKTTRPAISHLVVSVCPDGPEGGDDR